MQKRRHRHLKEQSSTTTTTITTATTIVLALLLASCAAAQNEAAAAVDQLGQWGQWRGPLMTGEAPRADPPVSWSETSNVRWKVELPGKGHSTPVVWGDRVYVTAAIPIGAARPPQYDRAPGVHDSKPVTHEHEFVALALSRSTGEILWKTTLATAFPHEGGHYTGSLVSNSPATDGEMIYAFFGSRGLYALDQNGKVVWQKKLGTMHTKHAHGEGSSPALAGNTLLVNWDHEGDSFVVAFDKRTGQERWRKERAEETSWASPIIFEFGGKLQAVVSGTVRIRSYDLETGEVLWECGGLSANVVASPVAGEGMVFAGSSYDAQAMVAIRLAGAKGDLTGTDAIAWSRTRGTPYVPSPLFYRGSLYFLRHYQPILTRVVAETGEERQGPFRLEGLRDIYASPVAAAGRVYVTDRSGATFVLSHEDEPKVMALNQLDDRFSASAAVAGSELFLRGEKFLYALRTETQ